MIELPRGVLGAAIEAARKERAYAEAISRCAFCRRHRDQLALLVVCGEAAICSECIAAAYQAAQQAMYRMVPCGSTNGHPPLAGPDPYTGEMCGLCFNFRMVRTGTCSTCQDCGSSSGGCS